MRNPGDIKRILRIIIKRLRKTKRRLADTAAVAQTMWPYYIPYPFRPVGGTRYFCQNAGGCGSAYIVELLKRNGIAHCYHEKYPDLDVLGIAYYEGQVSSARLRRLLIHTRQDVFFEANNRLFAMSKILREAFPDSSFIHLHRDPRSWVSSALSKPYSSTWGSGRRRYESKKLCGPADAPVLERTCHYWTNYNQRILDDLAGEVHLSLKFSDLIAGNLDSLERFIDHKLSVRRMPPVNADKAVRQEGRYAPFDNWSHEDQDVLLRICGEAMQSLGYEV